MKLRTFAILLAGLLLAACGFAGARYLPQVQPGSSQPNPATAAVGTPSVANGRQIYLTASDLDGNPIGYTGGPAFGGMMMGATYTCASCHGNDGTGGRHYMHMTVMDAPDVTYQGLVKMKQEDSGGNPTDYSLEDLRGAVVEGHDTAGKQLDGNMPRWQMSDQDLADLLAYLKMLP